MLTLRLLLCGALCVSIIPRPLRAASLEAFAGAVGGVGNGDIANGCTTFGPPPPVDFFGSPGFGVPIGGIGACGYAGGTTDIMVPPSAPGAFPATQSVSGAPIPLGSYSGSGSGAAAYGIL